DLGMLLFHDGHADEVTARREVGRGLVEPLDLLDHLRHGIRGDLRRGRVVDAAGDVAVRERDGARAQESVKHGTLLRVEESCPARCREPSGASSLYRARAWTRVRAS